MRAILLHPAEMIRRWVGQGGTFLKLYYPRTSSILPPFYYPFITHPYSLAWDLCKLCIPHTSDQPTYPPNIRKECPYCLESKGDWQIPRFNLSLCLPGIATCVCLIAIACRKNWCKNMDATRSEEQRTAMDATARDNGWARTTREARTCGLTPTYTLKVIIYIYLCHFAMFSHRTGSQDGIDCF